MTAYFYILCGVALCVVGEFASKLWASKPNRWLYALCVVAYGVSVVPWLSALRLKNQLIVVFMLWAVLQACVAVVIGLLFQERLCTAQWIGVVLGAASVVLLCVERS